MSYVDHDVDGETTKFPYLSPKSWVKFLLEKAPELVLGGCRDKDEGRSHLKAFWTSYAKEHPTHRLVNESSELRTFSNTLCLAFHGDEGRGLKKSNTTVLMIETNLGLDTWNNMKRKRIFHECTECEVEPETMNRFCNLAPGTPSQPDLCAFQTTNLKHHSFMTKYVVAVIPRKQTALLDKILVECTRDLISLFDDGVTLSNGERWFASITGLKGDLKWFVEKVGHLQRCFNKQLAPNTHMCHECLAGVHQYPFEDMGHSPTWGGTLYSERPYNLVPAVCLIPFEKDPPLNDGIHGDRKPSERVFRRDIFHNTKVGILRDFVGSTVMVLCKLRYFNEDGQSNGREHVLNRAYLHFAYFCKTTNRSPALRSFSAAFFNAPTWDAFPWVSAKGSDTSLLLAWIHILSAGLLNDPKNVQHVNLLRYINQAAGSARTFLRVTYSHGLWFSRHCAAAMYQELHKFLKCYNACAFLAMNQFQINAYAMKSKIHMLAHAKFDILQRLQDPTTRNIVNMQIWGCEMNEDVIGKVCRLSRKVSSRSTAQRTLQLVLVKSKALHRRFSGVRSKGLA